jgi:SAM-dependent methyltransferase
MGHGRRRRFVLFFLASASVAALLAVISAGLWKPVAKRSKWFLVADNIGHDLLRRTHIRTDQIGQSDALARTPDVPSALQRIDRTFDTYLQYSGLSTEALVRRSVLELGPGSDIGVALRFIAAGAPFVAANDKFVPLQDTDYHRSLYRALRDRLTTEERDRFDNAIDLTRGVALHNPRLRYIYGRGVEETDVFVPNSFDLIVSTAVLEEIYDTDRAFNAMHAALRPGGYILHKIDLRDYGMFTKYGFHALEFLTISDFFYERMVAASGQPNRRLVNFYREKTAALGYDTTIYTTWVLGSSRELQPYKTTLERGVDYTDQTLELISSIRPRLLPRYRSLPDADLMVQGIFLVARKPQTARLSGFDRRRDGH